LKPPKCHDKLNKLQTTQDKIMESARILPVNDGGTSGIGTTVLHCRTSGISGVSGSGLAKNFCIILLRKSEVISKHSKLAKTLSVRCGK
jgi:hypothetical protein